VRFSSWECTVRGCSMKLVNCLTTGSWPIGKQKNLLWLYFYPSS
jgi:hypothetical protein